MAFERPDWLPDSRNAVETERAVGGFWKTNRIFEKSLEQGRGRPTFVFYEGPPTANGRPHPGHVLTRVVKDVFPRYRTMTGMNVPRKAGWDTHGLPVEIEVEKELGLSSKEDIERYGVEPFVKKCMESVFRYTRDWEELTERIGFWVDLGEAYVTYRREYVESVWWALAELWKKKLLYQGHKIVPWCPRCGTALSSHEVGWGYKTVDDPSVTIKFRVTKLADGSRAPDGLYLLAWTTTPWTLLSNAALAVKPEAEYVFVNRDGDTFVLAATRVEAVLGEGAAVEKSVKGADLAGIEYEPLFPVETDRPAWRVVAADFVTLDEGTGIVHMAPAFGADDQLVGREHDLPMICRVDPQGHMTPDTGQFAGSFCKDADADIMRDLDERDLLVDRGTLRHEYPHCWRCESPLLYYPRAGWFIRTTEFRDRMLEHNSGITWFPAHIREGRFGNFLRDNVDWALSRERYWGTPLPIWKCEACSFTEAVAGMDDLRAREAEGFEVFEEARKTEKGKGKALDENLAIHKPYIDAVTYPCPRCSSIMRRVSEVIDCWFDSGAMPFAQWGYPRVEGSKEKLAAALPADFISEAIDQTRGWFYSLLAISTMLPGELGFGRAPYRNCVVLGLVCDDKGAKMSKSVGNYVEPGVILDKQGADAMRWYFLSANQPWTSVRFSERNVAMANKDFLIKLRNVVTFFLTYGRIDRFDPAAGPGSDAEAVTDARPSMWGDRRGRRDVTARAPLDRWILGELAGTIRTTRSCLDGYDAYGASQALASFVESLSNWYLRRSRSRFWGPGKGAEMGEDKLDAYWTLYEALVTTTLLIAPFTPFAAEEFYQTLVRSVWPKPESVHLCDYPTEDEFPTDDALARGMALAREASALGRAARAQAKIKVRMPLSEAVVVAPDATGADARLVESVADIVKDELNVKEVKVTRVAPEGMRLEAKLNYGRVGPRLGSKTPELAASVRQCDGRKLWEELRTNGTLQFVGEELDREDFDFRVSADEGYAAASGADLLVMLDAHVPDELRREGLAREIISRIQAQRKALDLPYEARIETYVGGSADIKEALEAHAEYVKKETLTKTLLSAPPEGANVEEAKVDGEEIEIAIRRA